MQSVVYQEVIYLHLRASSGAIESTSCYGYHNCTELSGSILGVALKCG